MSARRIILLGASLLVAGGIFTAVQVRAKNAPKVALPAAEDTAVKALAASPRHGEWVDVPLPGSDTKIHTWVVYPERKDKAPVVLVIHEIFGMTDWVRAVADQLAAEGFLAVAPDLVSGKGPNGGNSDSFPQGEIGAAVSGLSREEAAARLNAVRDYALAQPSAAKKTGSVGFCWGGGISFDYATRQPALNAAVVYYGTPPPTDALANIKAPVLGNYGGDDARVTSTVEPTKAAMAERKKSYAPHVYEGAGHGFLRQQNGRDGANLKAAQTAWGETIKFFKKNLK